MKYFVNLALMTLVAVSLSGCMTPSKESIQLTEQMITMIESAKTSHLALVDEFIVQQKMKADAYLDSTSEDYWEIFYTKPSVKQALEKTYVSKEEKEMVLKQIAQAGAQGMYAIRNELMAPIDQLQLGMHRKISAHYDNILLSARTILNYLKSSSQTQNQEDQIKVLAVNALDQYQRDVLPLSEIQEKLNTFFDQANGNIQKKAEVIKGIEGLSRDLLK